MCVLIVNGLRRPCSSWVLVNYCTEYLESSVLFAGERSKTGEATAKTDDRQRCDSTFPGISKMMR